MQNAIKTIKNTCFKIFIFLKTILHQAKIVPHSVHRSTNYK